MLNPTEIVAGILGEQLADNYMRAYSRREPRYAEAIGEAAKLVLERIGLSDALYHSSEHTAFVTLVGQDILRGERLRRDVTAEDWLHFTLATLTHDIGYIRGICRADRPGAYVIDTDGKTVTPPRGASDAFLGPWHIERSKLAVRERFGDHPFIDADRICGAIELTRFPVPEDDDYAETNTEAGLLRAADLIGQLADPFYPRKLNALFHELQETGYAARYGYATPADVADQYPRFFWSKVEPFIGDALPYLELTVDGRQWIANLYCNVFEIEHGRRSMGPHSGEDAVDGGRVGDGSRLRVEPKPQRGARRRSVPHA
ncbi:MAG TPA: metal-dependent phosphohydrolase [Beijerinckiaceae bacterium]|nr:metal-dependent phosphohydrolase [Beijerinckiaceae bacterium]